MKKRDTWILIDSKTSEQIRTQGELVSQTCDYFISKLQWL